MRAVAGGEVADGVAQAANAAAVEEAEAQQQRERERGEESSTCSPQLGGIPVLPLDPGWLKCSSWWLLLS